LAVFDKNLLFQRETVPRCHLGVKEKETTIWVGSGWIAVLRLFRNVGWDKMWASSGGSYWKLTARWIWGAALPGRGSPFASH